MFSQNTELTTSLPDSEPSVTPLLVKRRQGQPQPLHFLGPCLERRARDRTGLGILLHRGPAIRALSWSRSVFSIPVWSHLVRSLEGVWTYIRARLGVLTAASLDPLFLESGTRALGLQIASAAHPPPRASAPLDTSPRQLHSPGAWEEEGDAAQPHPDAHPPSEHETHTPTETRSLNPRALLPRGGASASSPDVPFPPTSGPAGSRWRDYSALAIIMAGIAFGFHQLYKKYLLPLIMGGREDRKQLERMEASLSELSGSVAQTVTQLQMTLASVQELLIQQQQKVQELAHELATAKATTSTNWILESQNISELKSEINSLKGLLLNRRQFPPSPSAPKIPSWQIPVKSPSPSSPAAVNHHSSSDISPVSNESTSSSPVKEGHSPEGSTATYHLLGPQEEGEGVVDVKDQVRMEVQGEEEKREDEEDEEDEDVSRVDEEGCLGVQREDRRGGDGQINEQVEKLRRPEGASNESERD
eukprot:bmy_06069T0